MRGAFSRDITAALRKNLSDVLGLYFAVTSKITLF